LPLDGGTAIETDLAATLAVTDLGDGSTQQCRIGSSGSLYAVGTAGGITGVGRSRPGLVGYSYTTDAVVGYALPPHGRSLEAS
jgi:hypothetical protein